MACDGIPFRSSNNEEQSANSIAETKSMAETMSVGLPKGAVSLTSNECENTRKRSTSSSSLSGAMDLSDHDIGEEDGPDDCPHFGEKKRKLTFEQVKTLEKSFELRNKLDPDRKMQLAKQLGLEPRQISVWFQNRRARWKTKQMEKDFDVLKHEYETLKRNYDMLLQKNRQFKDEVQWLSRELKINDQSSKVRASLIESQQKPENSVPNLTISPMELSVKSEICLNCTEQSRENYPTTIKEQEGGCCSYMTEAASSIFNIDSPRTIESPQSPGVPQIAAASANRSSPEIVVEGEVTTGVLKTPPPGSGLDEWHCLPKVEMDQGTEESWCKFLYSLEEQGSLMLCEYWPVPDESR